jgi:hypothetical protein
LVPAEKASIRAVLVRRSRRSGAIVLQRALHEALSIVPLLFLPMEHALTRRGIPGTSCISRAVLAPTRRFVFVLVINN